MQVRYFNADPASYSDVRFDTIWLEIAIEPIDETAYVGQALNRGVRIGHRDTGVFDFLAGRTKTDVDIWADQGNVVLASTGSRQTVIYEQTAFNGKDAFIVDGSDSKTNYGNQPTLELANAIEKRILIELDISASAIPATAWVESAYLQLQMSVSTGLDKNISFHRVLTTWDESLVTWEDPWVTFGGDFDPSPFAMTEVKYSDEEDILISWNITDALKDWGAGAHGTVYNNFGMIGIMENITLPDDKHFHSSETANVTHFPKLVVTYSDLSYLPSGVFESRILDAGGNVTWDIISWTEETTPGTTSLKVQTRTGSLFDPFFNPEAWTDWSPAPGYGDPSGDQVTSPPGRYLQYRVEFSTTHQNYTPVLSDMLIRWSQVKLSFDYYLDDLVNIDVATLRVSIDNVDNEVWSLSPGLMAGWASAEVDIGAYLYDDFSHFLALGLSLTSDNGGVTRAGARYDNVRISSPPYGEYFSPVWGSAVLMTWKNISWVETKPIGTNVEVRTRTGNSSFPDATWSPWSAPYTASSGEMVTNPPSFFIQYSLNLSTSDPSFLPEVDSVRIEFGSYESWGMVESITFSPPDVIE
ncbi:MAG: DNRLRE domain-containing protein, partial [Thermoplasmata archaeon]|nr:DNRLRE domain-containing protein [Thermoplasmata archaeon]